MKTLDNYSITFENTKIPVNIYEDSNLSQVYEIDIINVSKYTQIILDKIKEDIEREGIFEEKKNMSLEYNNLKKFFIQKVNELLKYYFPKMDIETKDKLVTFLVQKNLDLGFIDILISDSKIEEVTINGYKKNIMVYHRKFGWCETNLKLFSDEEIRSLISRIALDNKKNFSNLSPLLDAHLLGGHRVNATLDTISKEGSTMTIRRFSDDPWTAPQLINYKTASEKILAFIWVAIENEMSIVVSGGTGSGKTSFLNAISMFIPNDQRIISVEDTREIRLSDSSHWVPMEARQKNQEGLGEVTILDLIINSLRMRPDRIIIGEIRKKEEAQVLFEAMRTGHSVYGTFHANTAEETILRLSSPPIEIPKITLNAISLIVVQHRDRRSKKRYTLQIAEVDDTGKQNVIYQYLPKEEKYFKKNEPINLLKKLNEFYGITKAEFEKDLLEKSLILKFLTENKIFDMRRVEKTFTMYYKQKNKLLAIIKNINSKKLRASHTNTS